MSTAAQHWDTLRRFVRSGAATAVAQTAPAFVLVLQPEGLDDTLPHAVALGPRDTLDDVKAVAAKAFGFTSPEFVGVDDWAEARRKHAATSATVRSRRVATVAAAAAARAAEPSPYSPTPAGHALRRIEAFEVLYELLARPENEKGVAAKADVVTAAVLDGLLLHDGEDEVAGSAAAVGWRAVEASPALRSRLVAGGAARRGVALLQRYALRRADAMAVRPAAARPRAAW